LRATRSAVDRGLAAQWGRSAIRALADQLGSAIVRAFAGEGSQRSHERIAACSALVRRAEAYLRAQGDQPVSLSDLCAALQAGDARLREAYRRVYGTSPSRYLRLRRLHLARRKLRATRHEECSVSAAAASLGFFEFGRFAREYRATFGELPSRTPRAR
jgi:AraC-like DNA-binding protein